MIGLMIFICCGLLHAVAVMIFIKWVQAAPAARITDYKFEIPQGSALTQ